MELETSGWRMSLRVRLDARPGDGSGWTVRRKETRMTPRPRLHPAYLAAALIFAVLLVSAGLRSTPGVLMLPLEEAFGWSRSTVSLAAGVGILFYGLTGPFAAALMQGLGVRRVVISALALMASATLASTLMREPWQYVATWGVAAGIGSGALAMTLAATVVNRWFVARRSLMMGLLTAATATGNLIFLPMLALLAEDGGWRRAAAATGLAALALIPLVWRFLPEKPSDRGLAPLGAATPHEGPPTPAGGALALAFGALTRAARNPTFWLLFTGFFICGLTTNGLVGAHLIAMCADQGMAQVQAAGLLAVMGVFDLAGTTASGWLTDRYDPRRLLAIYYTFRGLALVALPFSDFSLLALGVFAVFFGLDWIATVPPTARLATEAFGLREGPIVFGWIAAGHQAGAATAAITAGVMRASQGRYLEAFVLAGLTALIAAVASLMIRRGVVSAAA